jgi:hypothetical protein
MHQRIIRYRVKPGQEDANAELARAVYAELHELAPDGLSYATFRLDEDPLSFVHVVRSLHNPNPLLAVRAFGEFQAGITERCDQQPVALDLTEVGSYRFFTG